MEHAESNSSTLERQAFLQSLFAARTIDLQQATALLEGIKRVSAPDSSTPSEKEVLDALDDLHSRLEPFGMDVVEWRDEITDTRRWMLLNKTAGLAARQATGLTAEEIGYFRAILSELFENSKDYSWSIVNYRDLGSKVDKQISRQELETLCQRLVDEGWLVERTHRFFIGPRTYVELKPYLVENFGDTLLYCRGCNQLFTRGKCCSTEKCTLRLHLKCEEAFYARNQGSSCPDCQQDLTANQLLIGI
jgi:hypothetical protein